MSRPTTIVADRRAGFTLVEMLVVLTIIGILMALLVPAILRAVNAANDARVVAEINTMSQGIARFQSDYGDVPPSRLILVESGFYDVSNTSSLGSYAGGWTGNTPPFSPTDLTYGQLAQRSLNYLRKFFPKAQFSTTGSPFGSNVGGANIPWYDFNGNGVYDPKPIYLEGHEALVFFLGGVPQPTANGFGAAGFAKDPTNPFRPFVPSPVTPGMYTDSRKPAYHEFRTERLIDDDNDGIPGFIDPRGSGTDGRYYVYFSSYGLGNYDPNDVNGVEADAGTSQGPIFNTFYTSFVVPGSNGPTNIIHSFAPNPYTSSVPEPPSGPTLWVNNTSYQIISPGRDRYYGFGGQYLPTSNGDRLPNPTPANSGDQLPLGGGRQSESDNLTNFATAKLD